MSKQNEETARMMREIRAKQRQQVEQQRQQLATQRAQRNNR